MGTGGGASGKLMVVDSGVDASVLWMVVVVVCGI